ncbi:MAG: hypothetical protein AMS18_10040 [Gemmatimonas sp. SG8_17]|nr:MAG: hypothetical protein AMS18_10040 [Gemmatimonas sp. SG8_17]
MITRQPFAAGFRLLVALICLVACTDPTSQGQAVRPGIDVLLADSIHLVAAKRVGLLTNQTGVDRAGVSDVDRLLQAGVELTALFSPEHGFRGVLEQATIGHATDSATGLPIFSLYGEQREPTAEMLAMIDVLLVDLQDIGARPYTYISTILLTLRATAAAGVPALILDRPNPIGGLQVQGPVLEPEFASFVGMLPVPLRHGLTIGELALFGDDVLEIGADLTVVPADGWQRELWHDQTGLPWVRPSPNMPDLESATHYPGTVLFEGTNLSVGRGTTIAFQVLGAPWLDPSDILAAVGQEPGVELSDTVVVPHAPSDGKYPDIALPALRLRVIDRASYDPTRLAVRLLGAISQLHPDSFEIRNARYFDNRAGSAAIRDWLDGEPPRAEIWRLWERDLAEFRRARQPHLIYE